jgi:nitrogen fixation NifU-like protein
MARPDLASLGWDELSDLYQEMLLDHYRNPRNHARIERPDIFAEEQNPFCGDEVAFQAVLSFPSGKDGLIHQVGAWGQGCSISQASLSIMSEMVRGKTLEEARSLSQSFKRIMLGGEPAQEELAGIGDLTALVGVRQYPIRIKCALLSWVALEEGVRAYLARAGNQQRP